jgi:hypothetical protein
MAKKQKEFAGMERPKIAAIESAADDYVSMRDKRMALVEKEISARTLLIQLMDEHKLTSYRYDNMVVTVLPAKKVKVKAAKDDGDDDDD